MLNVSVFLTGLDASVVVNRLYPETSYSKPKLPSLPEIISTNVSPDYSLTG